MNGGLRRAWSPSQWALPLPEGHRFPMAKYRLVREAVTARGILDEAHVHEPGPVPAELLELVHEAGYIRAVRDGTLPAPAQRRIGFPWQPALAERAVRTVQGTVEAARDALRDGAGLNLAGGTHHAFPGHGEGYCVFNDLAVAIRALRREGRIRRAVILDLDVHQGNGTAVIFAADPEVFTFSMHGASNFPFHKERSSLDVPLPDGCGDAEYLALLDRYLEPVLEAADADLACYVAGADPYVGDRLGRLGLSMDGLARRDRMVFAACARQGLPVVTVLGGGYAADQAEIATIHATMVHEFRRAYG